MSGNHKVLYNGELHKSKDLALQMPGKLNYVEIHYTMFLWEIMKQ
jgi:hypothetical protein